MLKGSRENVRFELEKLVDRVLVFHAIEDVRCKSYNMFKRLVKVMTFQTQLQLSNVFPCDTFIIQVEQFCANDHRINVLKADREKHLTVSMQFFEHIRVAVFQN